jgi:hypothetical protein
LKVLYADAVGTRGAAERLAACLARYHGQSHEARALVSCSFFRRGEPVGPPLWDAKDPAQRDACLDWADVVHLIHQTSYRSIGRPDMIGRRPTVYQRFTLLDKGDWYPRLWDAEDFKHLRLALVAEGWQRYPLWRGLDYAILPMVFDLEDPLLQPAAIAEREPRVFFGVMNKKDGPPAPKAYERTVKALRGLQLNVAHRLPFADTARLRQRSWVSIDEVLTPMIHFSVFESLAQGVPCVTRFDALTESTVKEATGADSVPFLNADVESVRVAVDQALSVDEEGMGRISSELRGWMERYMHPRDVMARYLALYGGA